MTDTFNDSRDDEDMLNVSDISESAPSSQESLSEVEMQAQKIRELELKIAGYDEKLLRARADFDNYRKRVQREMGELAGSVKSATLSDLLPVFDHYQFAVQAMNSGSDYDSLKQGMNLILEEFERFFKNIGVQKISATPGEPFDPKWHEAVSMENSSEYNENQIVREMKSGYRVDDRLIRAATVVVSSGSQTG